MLHAIPFALAQNGRLVEISQCDSGLVDVGVCPQCRGQLVARKGAVRAHHFAHRSRSACSGALESALHKAAKQVLMDALSEGEAFLVPEFRSGFFRRQRVNTRLLSVDCEKTVFLPGEFRRPDALVQLESGLLAIEILVSNPMDEDRIHFYESAGLDCIEIDLSGLAARFSAGEVLSIQDVANAVLRNPKLRSWKPCAEAVYRELKSTNDEHALPHFGRFWVAES